MKRIGILISLLVIPLFLLAQYGGTFARETFSWRGNLVTITLPPHSAEGRPWVWSSNTTLSSVDSVLLDKGFHIVGCDGINSDSEKQSLQQTDEFYEFVCRKYSLSIQPVLEGNGKSACFIFNWAARNPYKVGCIYVDSLYLNSAELQEVKRILPCMKLGNISVVGRYTEPNQGKSLRLIHESYQALGGVMNIIGGKIDYGIKKISDVESVVDFIVRNRKEYRNRQHIVHRSNLNNAFYRFLKEKKGCVAFLGGSITEMNGWRDMIKADLQQRFPNTTFQFIEVGIGSTGSTPHAFRFENDVLKQGTPDLLFVEAAVNDHTNGFGPVEQVRGMEGIVRHAWLTNPNMDIVMLHFIYAPFISKMRQGVLPDVVMNHERVANYYRLPSINLVQEIVERMDNNEFTWKDFGGTHPVWEGHKYYAAAICSLFDMNMCPVSELSMAPHPLPQKPLDEYSYVGGYFVDVRQAKSLEGFRYVDNWNPHDPGVECRKGFVNVPMLEATQAGSLLSLDFTGKAIGIFCVAGPRSCILEYSVDGLPYKLLNTQTAWSKSVYLPWVYMLETELKDGKHTLHLRVKEGEYTECQIRNFVVNGSLN